MHAHTYTHAHTCMRTHARMHTHTHTPVVYQGKGTEEKVFEKRKFSRKIYKY